MASQWRVLRLIVSYNPTCVVLVCCVLGRDQFGGSSGSGGGGSKASFDLFGTSDPFTVSMLG